MTPPLLPELYCADIERTLSFYTGSLGFKIMYARPEDKFARLERQGTEFMFEQYDPEHNRVWLAGPLEHPYGRGISFQIMTRHVDALYQNATDAGVKIFLPIEEKWYRRDDVYVGNRQFIVEDPDGYLMRFAEDLGTRKHTP